MKLIIQETIKIIHPITRHLPFHIRIKDGYVIEDKINLYQEEHMIVLFDWLEDFTEFDTTKLVVYHEDCICFYWGV